MHVLESCQTACWLLPANTSQVVVFPLFFVFKIPCDIHLRLLCEEFLSRQLQICLIETLNSNFGPAEWSLDLCPATVGEPSEVESLEFSIECII